METLNQDNKNSVNNAADVNNMPLEMQRVLEKICENYSERPLNAKFKSDSKIHCDLDRNQNSKKN